MKLYYKFISILLTFSLLLAEIPFAISQTSTPTGGNTSTSMDPGRISGTGFGTKDGKGTSPLGLPFSEQRGSYGELSYQIHILGEIDNPGTYRVPASTRLSEALKMAGGISGSERRIQIRRKEGGSRTVDLLSFKVFGNLDANPYLLDNDVIFVPLKKTIIQIVGTVQRPGIYELTHERTLQDVIKLTGGFTVGMTEQVPIKVIRYENGIKEVIDVGSEIQDRKTLKVKNADAIVVPHFLTKKNKFDYNLGQLPGEGGPFYPSYEERIFILGAVAQPGPYPFSPYYDVRQYLTLAGGTTKSAKTRRVKIVASDGSARKAGTYSDLNPGDTIIVPEKYMSPETFVTLILGVTSSVLAITSAVITLAR